MSNNISHLYSLNVILTQKLLHLFLLNNFLTQKILHPFLINNFLMQKHLHHQFSNLNQPLREKSDKKQKFKII